MVSQQMNLAGVDALRFAIVKQAVLDYDSASKWLRKHPPKGNDDYSRVCSRNARQGVKIECEKFFRSQWYAMLCDIDGEVMMRTIRQKYYNRPIRWTKNPYERRKI